MVSTSELDSTGISGADSGSVVSDCSSDDDGDHHQAEDVDRNESNPSPPPGGLDNLDTQVTDSELNDVVDISMSMTATYMKSPTTPAAEKFKALNSSRTYLGNHALEVSEDPEHAAAETESPVADEAERGDLLEPSAAPSQGGDAPLVLGRAKDGQHPRRSALAEVLATTRRRANSSITLAESVKRFLPELPKFSLKSPSLPTRFQGMKLLDFKDHISGPPKVSQKDPSSPRDNTGLGHYLSERAGGDPLSSSQEVDDLITRQRGRAPGHPDVKELSTRPPGEERPAVARPDSTRPSTSSLAHDRTPQPPRRAASADSLFLDRKITGASTWDDVTKYQHITEQANARFKVIVDSLADSNIRIPKLPSISLAALKPNNERVSSPESTKKAMTHTKAQPTTDSGKETLIGRKGDDSKIEYVNPSQRSHPVLAEALSQTEGDIIVMGGYRGSVLRDAKPPHRQLWAPVKIGLNIRKVDLEVGLTPEDEECMEEKIVSSGTLSHVGPIDICRRLLRHLQKCPNTRSGSLRLHDYGYDWRLSPHLLSRKLIQFLEGLECNQPETPAAKRGAWVIAHSLGGLIVRHAINQRPELFAGIVYAGTPQHAVNILGPLRNGDEVLMSSRVLTAQVNFTLRTSFVLLPLDGRCFIDKETGKRYDVDFFDPWTWDEYRLSPCISQPLPPLSQARENRRSIIDIISENLVLPSRLPSMFGGKEPSSSQPSAAESSTTPRQGTVNPENDIKQTLEPKMGSTSTSTAHQSRRLHSQSVATACTIPPDEARAYLSRTLADCKRFKMETEHIPMHEQNNRYPPASLIFGRSVPTVYGARVSSREAIKHSDAYDDLAFAAGDGVVLASAAQLPAGYRCVRSGRVETERGHVGLLGDLEGVGKCLAAVVEARARGVGLGNYHRGEEAKRT